MQFTSYRFFAFLAVLAVMYYLVPKKWQWKILLAGSFIFYAMADIRYFIYIGITVISTFVFTCLMEKKQRQAEDEMKRKQETMSTAVKKQIKAKAGKKKSRLLLLCFVINFGLWAVVKYIGVIPGIQAFISKSDTMTEWLIPLGISFYTFQAMGYAFDVCHGKCSAEKNPFRLALFISFFPQLIQGPISRYRDLKESLFGIHVFQSRRIERGVARILYGLLKKMVLADRIMPAVRQITQNADSYQGAYVLIGMLFYAYQLYADFTGGIDIAIGVAEVFDVRLTENFMRPYFSKSIKEYWKRWHITLGSWFTDYVFYPISVASPMLKLSKWCRKHLGNAVGKRIPVYLATVVVWLFTGMWHGASLNFIVWGMCNCFAMILSMEAEPLFLKLRPAETICRSFGYRLFQVVRTFFFISLFRTFDCYRSVPETMSMWLSLVTKHNWQQVINGGLELVSLTAGDAIILAVGVLVLLFVSLSERSGIDIRDRIGKLPYFVRATILMALFFSILIFGIYGQGYESGAFLYNQY